MRWIFLVLIAAGCTSNSLGEWETIFPPYREAFEATDYERVRVSIADSAVVLEDPRVARDSITGEWKPYYTRSVPLADVVGMEGQPYTHPAITSAVVLAGVGAIVALVAFTQSFCLLNCGDL